MIFHLMRHQIFLCTRLAAPITYPLYFIFEKSLTAGKVSSSWKNVFVIPIHNSGFEFVTSKYQPTNLTTIPCRLVKKLVKIEYLCLL